MQTQNVNDVIDHLAAKLSIPASHLWSVLVRQQRYEVLSGIIWSVAWALGAIAVWRLRARIEAWVQEGGSYSDREIALCFYYGARVAVIVVAFLVLAVNVNSIMGMLYNPEYYALKALLSAVSGK